LFLHLPFWLSFPREAGESASALAVVLVFALASLFVIPQRSGRNLLLLLLNNGPFSTPTPSPPLFVRSTLTPGSSESKINLQNLENFSTTKITTQITTIYHQFTTFYQPKTTSNSPYPQTLAL
jgi:hypothetical protein